MASTNLLSYISAFVNLSPEVFTKYSQSLGVEVSLTDEGKGMRLYELESLKIFVKEVINTDPQTYASILNNCNIGYTIPQIGKQFDLLWISENAVINVELKSKDTGEKILKQQINNHYYLSYLGKTIFQYTFISDSREFLYFDEKRQSMEKCEITHFCNTVLSSGSVCIDDLNLLFKPEDFLVSPFNNTERFINGEYFLTNSQEEIKKKVSEFVSSSCEQFKSIIGGAGTGKSLLVYDIANTLSSTKTVLIIHCGAINKGQEALIGRGWSIINPKEAKESNLAGFDVFIIDEAHRIYPTQRDFICEYVKNHQRKCIFSYDSKQWLHQIERINNNEEFFNGLINRQKPYTLSRKIRTNARVDGFIEGLFDKNKPLKENTHNCIHLSYCNGEETARVLLKQLSEDNWKVPKYTPGTYSTFSYEKLHQFDEDSVHEVIGQEYDRVAALIDEDFSYSRDGKLTTEDRDAYYSKSQMLYQILTRARKELHIVVYNNPPLFERCLQLIQ